MNLTPTFYFIADVESIGLHGEGFAAAYVVLDRKFNSIEFACFACSPDAATGDASDRNWIADMLKKLSDQNQSIVLNCVTPKAVRQQLFSAWLQWREKGASFFADCTWPVEANFLSSAMAEHIAQHGEPAKWQGPYPVVDIMTLEFAALYRNPSFVSPIRDEQQYALHHPLHDAQFSGQRLKAFLAIK